MLIKILGGITLFVVVMLLIYGGKLCVLVDRRWPLRYACQSLADVADHVRQHYRRALPRCMMHFESPVEHLNLGLYKYCSALDPHIYYFVVFIGVKRVHPLYDDLRSFLEIKGYMPSDGITIHKGKAKDAAVQHCELGYKYHLTCEIQRPDDAIDIIDAVVKKYGTPVEYEPMFSVYVTGSVTEFDELFAPVQSYKELKETVLDDAFGKLKPCRPYQRWHKESPRLTYWALRYLKELIFGRKKEIIFTPICGNQGSTHNSNTTCIKQNIISKDTLRNTEHRNTGRHPPND